MGKTEWAKSRFENPLEGGLAGRGEHGHLHMNMARQELEAILKNQRWARLLLFGNGLRRKLRQ